MKKFRVVINDAEFKKLDFEVSGFISSQDEPYYASINSETNNSIKVEFYYMFSEEPKERISNNGISIEYGIKSGKIYICIFENIPNNKTVEECRKNLKSQRVNDVRFEGNIKTLLIIIRNIITTKAIIDLFKNK